MKDKRVATVGHFWILMYNTHPFGIHFRIINTNNGIMNKTSWSTQLAAMKYADKLMKWHKGNKSKPGQRRTAIHNEKVVAKYHKTKVQPKDWKNL